MQKKIIVYLLFNWRTGEVLVKKRFPKNYGGFWIPMKLNMTLHIPDNGTIEMNAEVEVPDTKLVDFMVEALRND